MGATAKPSPELFTDGVAFAERTGKINYWQELLSLGLEPDNMSGGFFTEKSDILLNFVRRDPAYHIITFASDQYVNRFVAGRNTIYYLADGDADPSLACNQLLAPDWHLIFVDTISETLAMLKDIKDRRQTKS